MSASFVQPPLADKPAGPWKLVDASLRRPGGRRSLSVLATVLFLAGVGMFMFPFATNLYSDYRQGQAANSFKDPKLAIAYQNHSAIAEGTGLTKLTIKSIDLTVLVVQGTGPDALRAGAGHYTNTPLPCEDGNVAIAGHRTTFGHPFNRLDEVKTGDEAYLDTPTQRCYYTLQAASALPSTITAKTNPFAVSPNNISILATDPNNAKTLTLTTCNPKGSAAQRLIARFVFEKSVPISQVTSS